MWDLFHSIPSIETEGVSVLDEYYWLNKEDPNYPLCRATVDRGQDAHTDGKFDISDKGAMEIMKLCFTPNEDLQDKKSTDFFDDEEMCIRDRACHAKGQPVLVGTVSIEKNELLGKMLTREGIKLSLIHIYCR